MTAERTVAGRDQRSASTVTIIKFSLLYFALALLSGGDKFAAAFCHPGCRCADELRTVECINITSIPILFHPMLRSLTVRQSPQLALDSVSIGLYQELELLDLSANGLRDIPDGFFNALKKLRDLRLRANRLGAFDPRALGLAHRHHVSPIQELDLSDNEIERIATPKHHDWTLPALRYLNLSGNRLHHLEPFGGWARGLTTLDLSRNRIAAIGQTLFNQTGNLERLDLSENILSEINANVFTRQRALTHLNLARNLLADFDALAFFGLHNLRELNLPNCMISSLAALRRNWRHVPELRRLTLSANPITELDTMTFDGLYALEVLTLSGMPQLRTIKDASLAGLISLRELALNDCPLVDFLPVRLFGEGRGGALPPARLQHLDFSGNALTTIDVALLDDGGWMRLETLNLAGNRWRCDCALLSFLPRSLSGTRAAPPAFCSSPDAFFNVDIREVKHSTHCQSSSQTGTPLFALITVAAAVLATLTTLMATTALLCCCCWRYNYGSGSSSGEAHLNGLKLYRDETPRSRRLLGRLAVLPLLRRCDKSDSSAPTGAKMCTTASTSSSSAASSTSTSSYSNQAAENYCSQTTNSYGNKTARCHNAAGSYCHQTGDSQKYYDKAADISAMPHSVIIPYDGDGNDYYSCIPSGPSIDTSTFTGGGDYCLPPPNNYCTYGRASHTPLIAYGTSDTLAYPPYLYQSPSNYGMRTIDCCCTTVSARQAPAFVAPPPPATLPPPPTATVTTNEI